MLHGTLLLYRREAIRSQLAPHLPEGTEPTAAAMAELLRSPQFAQTTQNLTQVCMPTLSITLLISGD